MNRNSARLTDCIALVIVALLSLAPYRASLGFYSDDYATLASFALADDRSIYGLFSLMTEPYANVRPVQVVSVLLYRQFGLAPLGYQVVIWIIYAMLAPALYLVLWALRQPRLVALTVALLFVCLPQSSTN